MKSSILYFFLTLFPAIGFAENGTVETTASNESKVIYFHEEKHPTKMDWESLTLCWGANSDAGNHEASSDKNSSAASSGKLDSNIFVNGPLGRMLANQLEWNSYFDKKDFTFNVNIKRTIAARIDMHEESTCTTHDWSYKVDKVSDQVVTSVQLTVPQNAWVMRVKTLKNLSGQEAVIVRARSMPAVQYQKADFRDNIDLNGYQYFFTKPGEDFKIQLIFKDENVKNVELMASFEVTFIGQNRCDQVAKEITGDAQALTSGEAAKNIEIGLKNIENIFQNSNVYENADTLNQSVVFVGCLMNKSVSDSLLYNNDAEDISKLLNSLFSFESRVHERLLKQKINPDGGEALTLLTQMSIASLAINQMESLKPYCQKFSVFDSETGKKSGTQPGYVRMVKNLRKARAVYGSGFTSYFKQVNELHQSMVAGAKTYSDLLNDSRRRDRVLLFAQALQADNKLMVTHHITSLLLKLPDLKATATTVNLARSAQNLEHLVARLQGYFFIEFELIADRDETPFRKINFDEIIRSLEKEEKVFIESLHKLLSLVDLNEDGEIASRFKAASQDFIMTIIPRSKSWLSSVYQGYFVEFLALLDLDFARDLKTNSLNEKNNYQTKTFEEISECLANFSTVD